MKIDLIFFLNIKILLNKNLSINVFLIDDHYMLYVMIWYYMWLYGNMMTIWWLMFNEEKYF